jgi:hypothetical protein
MKNKIVVLLAGLALLFAAGCSSKGAPAEFSAESIMKSGGHVIRSKVYVSGGKIRTESSAYGQKSISIIREDKNIAWMIMPAQKMYMEQKIPNEPVVIKGGKMPGELKRKKVGSGKVAGVQCDKYEVIYKPKGQDAEMKTYQWISANGMPLKTAAADGSWYMEYRKLKVGKQPDALFELPAGYKKFKVPAMKF